MSRSACQSRAQLPPATFFRRPAPFAGAEGAGWRKNPPYAAAESDAGAAGRCFFGAAFLAKRVKRATSPVRNIASIYERAVVKRVRGGCGDSKHLFGVIALDAPLIDFEAGPIHACRLTIRYG